MTTGKYSKEISELDSFVEICIYGVSYGLYAKELLEVLPRLKEGPGAQERAERFERFAKAQEPHGFSYVFEVATIRLWSLLEAFVDEIVADRIQQQSPEILPALRRIKGPLVDFLNANDDERVEFLLEKLKEQINAPLKKGSGRFESLLEQAGLGGPIDDEIRRALMELSEVRNVLVHRNATADRRFQEACPWFKVTQKQRVRLDQHHYKMYSLAALWYVLEIDRRLGPTDRISERQLKIQADFVQRVTAFMQSRKDAIAIQPSA